MIINRRANKNNQLKNNKIIDIILSMRPKQFIKNAFVFAGLIFSKSFFNYELVLRTVYAFIIFCLVSGSVYIINDIIDRDKDVVHPKKRNRPIASGRLKPFDAILAVFLLTVIAFYISYRLDREFFLIVTGYFLLMLLYSVVLKNFAIIDVIIISQGFVLRTLGGTTIIDVEISPWLIMCTTFLSLFLGLNKRKDELVVLSDNASVHRRNLGEYTPEMIDQMLPAVTSLTIISYSLYTFTSGKSYYMMFTVPFVIYGIFRYQYLASSKCTGESPENIVLKDKPLLINVILWVISCILIVRFYY